MAKAYLWDWSLVPAHGPRFENLVAMHLLKLCHYLRDHNGLDASLYYVRDRAGRELDFLVTIGRTPWIAVEAKVSGSIPDSKWSRKPYREISGQLVAGGFRSRDAGLSRNNISWLSLCNSATTSYEVNDPGLDYKYGICPGDT